MAKCLPEESCLKIKCPENTELLAGDMSIVCEKVKVLLLCG
jgi:hypothetical protein